jgi:hypothetical protein
METGVSSITVSWYGVLRCGHGFEVDAMQMQGRMELVEG